MDLSRPVVYRGVNINDLTIPNGGPLDGYRVDAFEMRPVDGIGYREKRSLDDGEDFSRVYLSGRTYVLRGTVFAITLGSLHDRMSVLRTLFNPVLCYADDEPGHGFLPLSFSWLTENTNDFETGIISVAAGVRPAYVPGFDILRASSSDFDVNDNEGGFSIPYQVVLLAKDPRIYGSTVTDAFPAGASSLVSRGNYYSPVFIELVAPASSATQITTTLTGFGTVMTIRVPGNEGAVKRTLRVDSYRKVATLQVGNAVTPRLDLVSFSSGITYPKAIPGVNAYTWTKDSGQTPDATSRIFFQEAWS
jgi:hypothetical protein